MNKWGSKSKANYDTLHPDLQVFADEVLKVHDCSIFEGFRDEATQNKYFLNGTSHVPWPQGKHNVNPSRAIDLAPYIPNADPYDMERVLFFAGICMGIAHKLYDENQIANEIKWGGTWSTKADDAFMFDVIKPNGNKGFFDGIHFELVEQSHYKGDFL